MVCSYHRKLGVDSNVDGIRKNMHWAESKLLTNLQTDGQGRIHGYNWHYLTHSPDQLKRRILTLVPTQTSSRSPP